jgi:hypothetical protein
MQTRKSGKSADLARPMNGILKDARVARQPKESSAMVATSAARARGPQAEQTYV